MIPFHRDPAFYVWSFIGLVLFSSLIVIRATDRHRPISSVWQVVSR